MPQLSLQQARQFFPDQLTDKELQQLIDETTAFQLRILDGLFEEGGGEIE